MDIGSILFRMTSHAAVADWLDRYEQAWRTNDPDQIRALKLCAVLEDRRLSDVLREAVDRYLRTCASGEVRRQLKLG